MFIDYTKITCYAGKGGAGAVSFRREKFIPKGGPDGGDGGKGGDIIFVVDTNLNTLQDIRYNRIYKAQNGNPGGGSRKTGKDGENIILRVPPGTILRNTEDNSIVADLVDNGEEFIACKGGKGGKGNVHFKSATRQTPRFAQPGLPGEDGNYDLELKVLADVGLVGLPNAGKSTLLSRLSAATPKIADYPFTTLQPHLGIVKLGEIRSFVMADIPGLIEGASEGKGLGHQFLRHIERNHLLLFLIDSQADNPDKILATLKQELYSYNPALKEKSYLIVRTKCDLSDINPDWKKITEKVYDISSVSGTGLKILVAEIDAKLNEI